MGIKAVVNEVTIADSTNAELVEGNYYFPRDAVKEEFLQESPTQYTCAWKGECTYYNIVVDAEHTVEDGAWSYVKPSPAAERIAGHIAFAPQVQIVVFD